MTKCAFHVGEEIDVIGAAFADELNQSKDYVNQGGRKDCLKYAHCDWGYV